MIGVDAGGTFTDAVGMAPDGSLRFHKRPSTPERPEDAVLACVRALAAGGRVERVAHGSTVATNAFLEGRLAPVGLVVPEGLEDVVAIGRQNRRRLYDLRPVGARRLVPPERIRGVRARTGADGALVAPLLPGELRAAADALARAGARALAVCLLHSARHPALEREAEAILGDGPLPVVTSHRASPEPREVERWTTAIVSAGLRPVVARYLARLAQLLDPIELRVMLSNGGLATADEAAGRPVATLLSGPAAGVVGARRVAAEAGHERLVTLDMGGTSCDVAVVVGGIERTTEGEIDGVPIRIPLVDVTTAGAGGGSIARVDRAGALAVGPGSAGAVPGPACYGQGGERPTVTDAHLLLGHLDPDRFAAVRRLDADAARRAVAPLAARLGVPVRRAAAAVLAVARSRLVRTVRRMTLERGHDPAGFTLVAFGGAGGLHAGALAEALGMRRVLVPRAAGVLSALGCVAADTRLDFARALLVPVDADGIAALGDAFEGLDHEADAALAREGVPAADRSLARTAALRYRGQSYETDVPLAEPPREPGALARAFHDRHRERYGYARPDAGVEIVAARVAAVGRAGPLALPRHEAAPGRPERRRVGLADGEEAEAEAWSWDAVPAGHAGRGPAVVFGDHATALVPPGWAWRVDRHGNLALEAG